MSNEYRKTVLRRTCKKDLLMMAVTLAILILLFGLVVVLPEFPRYIIFIIFILYAIFFVIIWDISIMTMWRLKRWSITIGTIVEVFLEDEEQSPTSTAKISFLASDGKEYIHEQAIQCYGDYEEGCEEKVRNMIEEDKKQYENKQVHVFYHPSSPERCLVMMDDLLMV